MTHANAPLNVEGRRRLVERCRNRPIAHVAAEAAVPRACLSKGKNRYDTYAEKGLLDRSGVPHSSPTQTPPAIVEKIEQRRRNQVVRPPLNNAPGQYTQGFLVTPRGFSSIVEERRTNRRRSQG